MANMVPGTHTGWNRITYQDTFEMATYQKIIFTDLIDRYEPKLLGTGTVRKHARELGQVLSQTASGLSLTYNTLTDTAATITAVQRYAAASWTQAFKSQIDADLQGEAGENLRQAMAETLDVAGLETVASLTNTMSQASIDVAMWRQATGRLQGNTNGMAELGVSDIKAVISHTQIPNVMAIEEFTHADIRGGSETPNVKGVFTKGGGINVRFTTVVYADGNGWHNVVFIPSAFVVGWNDDISLKDMQEDELQFRLIAVANNGYAVKHNARAIALRTTASGL